MNREGVVDEVKVRGDAHNARRSTCCTAHSAVKQVVVGAFRIAEREDTETQGLNRFERVSSEFLVLLVPVSGNRPKLRCRQGGDATGL